MSVTVCGVERNSYAYYGGIQAGDILCTINGNEINDVLDYRFYIIETKLRLEFMHGDELRCINIQKEEYEDIGLEFETYLMDKQRHCCNKCVFCFIDQLPKGLRPSLYFKDDDSRLSFLFGNYITLTNISEKEVERIIKMHISPINISVHTTNPELRVKMMKNKNAGKALDIIKRFTDAGIMVNAQLVLCPGLNDKNELRRSLNDLGALYPNIQSIACVPVGLTKYREGLHELRPFTAAEARETVGIIENFGDKFKAEHGTRLAYPGDEFYLLGGLPVPQPEFYEEFAQIENGVGMWASLKSEFTERLEAAEVSDLSASRHISVATGKAAAPLLRNLVDEATKKWHNLKVEVYEIKNRFFGENITVSGLLTGKDFTEQLSGKELGTELLIPADSLRREGDVFLDDMSLEELSLNLNTPVHPVSNDGWELLDAILGL